MQKLGSFKVAGDKALSAILMRLVLGTLPGIARNKVNPKAVINNLSEDLSNHEQAVILQTIVNSKLALDFISNGDYRNVQMIDYQELGSLLQKYNIEPFLLDEQYAVMPDRMAFTIFNSDVIDLMQYVSDLFDCDNYAYLFSSLCSAQFLINSVGVCFGKLINPDTKELIGYHAFNLAPVISTSTGNIELYIFEPQLGEYTTIDKPVIANLEYVPVLAEFY